MKFVRWARVVAACCVTTAAALTLTSCGGGYAIDWLYVVSSNQSGAGAGVVNIYAVNNDLGGISQNGAGGGSTGGNGPSAVVATHDGDSLFVANQAGGNVSGFGISQGNGALSNGSTVTTPGGSPVALAVDLAAKYLFVVDNAPPAGNTDPLVGGVLSCYTIASGGKLTLSSSEPLPLSPLGVATTTDGASVFVTAFSGTTGVIAPFSNSGGTLAASPTVYAGSTPWGIAVEPLNRFVYAVDSAQNQVVGWSIGVNNNIVSLSPINMGGNTGGVPTLGYKPTAIAIEPRGRYVYITNSQSNTILGYQINQSSGALTQVGSTAATSTQPVAITVEPLQGTYVYVANKADNSVSAYKITTSTGVLSLVSGTPFAGVGDAPTALAASPKGQAPIPGQP